MNPQDDTGKQVISEVVSAEVSAVQSENCSSPPPPDPSVDLVIEAWPKLPEAIREGILAMVRVAAEGVKGYTG